MVENTARTYSFHVKVETLGQLQCLKIFGKSHSIEGNKREYPINRVYVNGDCLLEYPEALTICQELNLPIVVSLPAILRDYDHEYLAKILDLFSQYSFLTGVLINNLEAIGFLKENSFEGNIYADAGFYLWNSTAVKMWDTILSGACLPLELKAGEQHALLRGCKSNDLIHLKSDACFISDYSWEKIIYGRIPMMQTANCVAKTSKGCQKSTKDANGIFFLKDRLGKQFPVQLHCSHCFNTIYNSIPLSLHSEIGHWYDTVALRLDFTIEDTKEVEKLLNYYLNLGQVKHSKEIPPLTDYTTGHERRGTL